MQRRGRFTAKRGPIGYQESPNHSVQTRAGHCLDYLQLKDISFCVTLRDRIQAAFHRVTEKEMKNIELLLFQTLWGPIQAGESSRLGESDIVVRVGEPVNERLDITSRLSSGQKDQRVPQWILGRAEILN